MNIYTTLKLTCSQCNKCFEGFYFQAVEQGWQFTSEPVKCESCAFGVKPTKVIKKANKKKEGENE